MLLVVLAMPKALAAIDGAAVKAIAGAIGAAPADVRMRLAGRLPRVLASDSDGAALAAAAEALEALGLQTVVCDPTEAPSDRERVIGRRVNPSSADGALQVWDGAETCHEIPRAAVQLLQRGVRAATEQRTVTTTQRKFDAGRALLSGGLMLTKKSTQTSTTTTETREPFLLVQRAGGEGDVILYERRLDYRFLGTDLQPSSHANFERLVAAVRAFCPQAPFDDRVGQAGFLQGLPATAAEPTDLGLYLITLAQARAAAFRG
ncbi:MAG TPA: hypothetical protein VNO55_18100 [Polyangia bacterium]|nr:hypothetical protein [Polyangia bacterium]